MLCISSFIRSLAVSSSFFSSFLYLKLSFVLLFDCKVKKKKRYLSGFQPEKYHFLIFFILSVNIYCINLTYTVISAERGTSEEYNNVLGGEIWYN